MSERTKVLLISGSLRAGSTNSAVIRTIAELAEDRWEATVYDGLRTLPHFDPDEDREPLAGPVTELRAALDQADAVIVCTPEYAGDLPGSFKNLLDWTVGGMEIVGKPVAWINCSTSGTAAAGTHAALRTVLTYTGAVVVDDACRQLPVLRDAVGDRGVVTDAAVRDELRSAVRSLLGNVDR